MSAPPFYQSIVIGGGFYGCSLAVALAEQGRKVLLCEQGRLVVDAASLMGVRLQQAHWQADVHAQVPPSVAASPELRALRVACAALLEAAAPLGAVAGNLERLSQEYRRSVRRARALQDVLLPELEREMAGVESALDEGERQEALAMRHGRV